MSEEARDRMGGESIVAGPQVVAAVTPREAPATAPVVLSEAERALLAAALDRIIPAEGDFPGAGALGVAAPIERTMAISRALRRLFLEGFVQIALASGRHARDGEFVTLDADEKDDVLRAVEQSHPAFFEALVEHAYRGYYADPRVHRVIGWESRPPQPLGHELPRFDEALLTRQRVRAPFWRPAS